MSTLYIRLPSRAAADGASALQSFPCAFALASNGGAIEREGMSALSALSAMVAKAQHVVLLLAAGDVTLLRVKVPPLSAARLKAALPNLVEDQLVTDPAECVVVAGDAADGLRTVAVVQRDWLQRLNKMLRALGARSLAALPAQLCLPHQPDSVAAAVAAQGADIDLTLRLSQQEGLGLSLTPEQPASAAGDVLQALCAVVPLAAITLYVAQSSMRTYQDAIGSAALDSRIALHADNWSRWIGGASMASLNLMAGLGAAAGVQRDWRPWRWPLALAAALLVVNIAGLHIDWLHMKREADALRAAMLQIYKSAYPKETVILDPIAQMRQKLAAAQHEAGQAAPDDFVALAAAVGEAWAAAERKPAIAALEYRERSLSLRLKAESGASMEQMKAALAARNLVLTQAADGAWQIRSAP